MSVAGSRCSVYTCSCSAAESHSIYTCTSCQQRAVAESKRRAREGKPPLSPAAAGGSGIAAASPSSAAAGRARSLTPSKLNNAKRSLTPDALRRLEAKFGIADTRSGPVSRRSNVERPQSVASSMTHTSGGKGSKAGSASRTTSLATEDVRRLVQLEAELAQERSAKEELKNQVTNLSQMQQRLEDLLQQRYSQVVPSPTVEEIAAENQRRTANQSPASTTKQNDKNVAFSGIKRDNQPPLMSMLSPTTY